MALVVMALGGCGKPDLAAGHARLAVDPAVYAHFTALLKLFSHDAKRRAVLRDGEMAWLKQREADCGSGEALDTDCGARADDARLKYLRTREFLAILRSRAPEGSTVAKGNSAPLENRLPFSPVNAVASPQGDTLAIAGAGEVAVIDTASGRLQWKEQPGAHYDVIEYSPNGRLVMVGSSDRRGMPARFYDVSSGEQLVSIDSAVKPAWIGGDGRYLAHVAGEHAERLVVRDIATGAQVSSVPAGSGDAISALAIDGKGTQLATYSRGTVTLYDVIVGPDDDAPPVQLKRMARNSSQADPGKYHDASHMFFAGDGRHLYVLTPYDATILGYVVPGLAPDGAVALGTAQLAAAPAVTQVPGRGQVVITTHGDDAPADYPHAFVLDLTTRQCAPLPMPIAAQSADRSLAAPLGAAGRIAYIRRDRVWTSPEPGAEKYQVFTPRVLTGPRISIGGDFRVHAIGVETGVHANGAERLGGVVGQSTVVQVKVEKMDKPVVLVLASYRPVLWLVDDPGNNVRQMLISGPGTSRAFGPKNAAQANIGEAWAYRRNSAHYRQLDAEVQRRIGRGIDAFQGKRSAALFAIGAGNVTGESSQGDATTASLWQVPTDGGMRTGTGEARAGAYKWTDASGKVHYGDRPPEARPAQAITLKPDPAAAPADGKDEPPQAGGPAPAYQYELVMTHALKDNKPVDKLDSIRISPQQKGVYFVTRLSDLQSSYTKEDTIPVRTRVLDSAGKVIFDSTTTIARNGNTTTAYFWALVYPNTAEDAPGNWTVQVMADGKPLYREKRRVQF